jgi:sulfoxide reductase heme-binding subunit YedZ
MFVVALVHGAFSIVQFHAFGDVPPLVSLFISNTRFVSAADFPFELAGVGALIILFLMAATSHDFWLHTLSPGVWKRLHMLVYVAYSLLITHVLLGALQTVGNNTVAVLLGAAMLVVISLHLAAGARERRIDRAAAQAGADGFIEVGEIRAIPEKRARVISANGERIAVFRYDGKVSAISNVCRHQNGPLGEGRIIDGCITCPWHGYQYTPDSGASPPPFNDKVATFQTKIIGDKVFVHPCPHPPGTRLEPSLTESSHAGAVL